MTSRVVWVPAFATGEPDLDARHQDLLARCNRLADLCDAPAGFDAAYAQLKATLREHFEAEAARLSAHGEAALEDHRAECEEFEYLAGQIATTANFDRRELQRFVAAWCLGHVAGAARD